MTMMMMKMVMMMMMINNQAAWMKPYAYSPCMEALGSDLGKHILSVLF